MVNHGNFATGAVAGIDAHHHPAAQRRLEEQVAQVGRKDLDGVVAGLVGAGGAQLPFQAGQQQAIDAVGDGGLDLGAQSRRSIVAQEAGSDQRDGILSGQGQCHFEGTLGLAAVDGQRLMGLKLGQGQGDVVVEAVLAAGVDAGLLAGCPADDDGPLQRKAAGLSTGVSILGKLLGQDVTGTGQGRLDVGHLAGEEGGSQGFRRAAVLLGQQLVGQGLKAPLASDGCPRPALGLERQV